MMVKINLVLLQFLVGGRLRRDWESKQEKHWEEGKKTRESVTLKPSAECFRAEGPSSITKCHYSPSIRELGRT